MNNEAIKPKSLDEIMAGYNTDKSSLFHDYCRLYEMYFYNKRNSIKKVLEIGIGEGRSLSGWRDYFPNAQIVGIDIVNIPQHDKNNERITKLTGNVTDVDFIEKEVNPLGPFDIIIDDGSHQSSDITLALDYCYRHLLSDNGMYVIEDGLICYNGIFKEASLIKKGPDIMEYLLDVIKELNWWRRGADCANIKRFERISPDNHWQVDTEFIHIYRGLVFIKKRNIQ